jgi:hypothetical protein
VLENVGSNLSSVNSRIINRIPYLAITLFAHFYSELIYPGSQRRNLFCSPKIKSFENEFLYCQLTNTKSGEDCMCTQGQKQKCWSCVLVQKRFFFNQFTPLISSVQNCIFAKPLFLKGV